MKNRVNDRFWSTVLNFDDKLFDVDVDTAQRNNYRAEPSNQGAGTSSQHSGKPSWVDEVLNFMTLMKMMKVMKAMKMRI